MTPVSAIAAVGSSQPITPAAVTGGVLGPTAPTGGFGALLQHGLASMDAKVANADRLVAQFALDDSVPVHQVTIALEEARLSVEFAMQVRQRVVDAYKELMNMQL